MSLFSSEFSYQRVASESQDALIAQRLLEAERKRLEEEEEKDRKFAMQLQMEEEQAEKARLDRVKREQLGQQRVAEDLKRALEEKEREREREEATRKRLAQEEEEKKKRAQEEALRMIAEQRRLQEQREQEKREQERRDAELAHKLEAEEKKKKQEEEDEELAKRLDTQLNISSYSPPSKYGYPSHNYNHHHSGNYWTNYPTYSAPAYTTATNVVNAHTHHIHRQYCACAKTNTWDANHIIAVHDSHCSCANPRAVQHPSNEGSVHQHTSKCCRKNHVHSQACHCDYRNHVHTARCCNKYHTHNLYCHCSNK